VLPLAAFGGLLVNLAGAAPYFARRQLCLLHDAAVFDQPQAYTRAFAGWYRALFRHLARSRARLITVSAFSRTRLALRLGLAPARIGIVPNGGDHLDELAADERVLARHGLVGVPYLLSVGSANPTKNLGRLIEAHALMGADRGIKPSRLVIVGGGNDQVFAPAAAAGSQGVVRTGPIDDAELKALYLHADAMVFPSVYEGFGLPPLEAMACGCPVAASNAASIPEVCGDAALYFDPLSVSAIAAAMRQIRLDEALRARLRSAGFARVGTARWADAAALLLGAVQEESGVAGASENAA
jgi:glycosyltransferase involved in cell wall biosynthesis